MSRRAFREDAGLEGRPISPYRISLAEKVTTAACTYYSDTVILGHICNAEYPLCVVQDGTGKVKSRRL